MPGPNDFHYAQDEKTGVLVMRQGLGADEPSEAEHQRQQREALAREEKEAALARAQQSLEAMGEELSAREAAIAERERRLLEREKELTESVSADVAAAENAAPARRKVATERVGA